jgi:hypothetical protein
VIEIGDLVKLDWPYGFKSLGYGIVVERYKGEATPLKVWWFKVAEAGWEDTDMLIKVEEPDK